MSARRADAYKPVPRIVRPKSPSLSQTHRTGPASVSRFRPIRRSRPAADDCEPLHLTPAQAAGIASTAESVLHFAQIVALVIKQIRAGGVTSLRGVAALLNKHGVRTARSGRWAATQMGAVLARAAALNNRQEAFELSLASETLILSN